MNSQLLTIRAKKLGIRLIDLREKYHYSVEDLAAYLGITPDELIDAEQGVDSLSLSKLESLAELYRLPLESLLNWDVKSKTLSDEKKEYAIKSANLHDHILAAHLKKARYAQQLTLDDLAEVCEISTDEYLQYENAEKPLPYPLLDALCGRLNLDLSRLQSKKAVAEVNTPVEGRKETLPASHLPAALQDFVAKPSNQPYLELARKLSEYDVNRLRHIAESLLEITY